MKWDNILVSVIIPAYNHEEYIGQCIESIVNQEYKNIELIILNDGSKDNTANIIKSYEETCKERFTKFKFIDKQNEGVSKTLNKGINISSGDYICFIASDDIMIEGRIKKQVEFMLNKNSFISCGNSLMIKGNNKTDEPVLSDKLKKMYFDGNQFCNLIINYFISSPTVMLKRDIVKSIGLFDGKFKIEDWPYYVKVAQKYKIDFLDDYLCYYRIHDHNTQTNKKNMFIEEKKILMYFFQNYNLSFNIKRKALSQLYIRNKDRNDSSLGKIVDLLISQVYYFDFYKIGNYLAKYI
jgi:alpha-1,3-rhamnosyltransferase